MKQRLEYIDQLNANFECIFESFFYTSIGNSDCIDYSCGDLCFMRLIG